MRVEKMYYTFGGLHMFGIGVVAPAYSPYMLSIGLSLAEISLVNSVFWIIMICAELPTGMLADGKSRAWSLKFGALFFSTGAVGYSIATDVISVALSEAVIGLGASMVSGAKQAWITDALDKVGRKDDVRKVFATDAIITSFLMMAGGFIGAYIATINYRYIWGPLIFCNIIAAAIAYKAMSGKGEPNVRVNEFVALRKSIEHLKKSRSLQWVISITILSSCVICFNHYWSIYFKPTVGQINLSWVWVLIYMSMMLSGMYVRNAKIRPGKEVALIIGSVVISGSGLVLVSCFNGLMLSLTAVVIHEIGRGIFFPLVDAFIQTRARSSYRATFGSLQSFIGGSGFAIVLLCMWLALSGEPESNKTIDMVWSVCGSILIVGGIIFWLFRPKEK